MACTLAHAQLSDMDITADRHPILVQGNTVQSFGGAVTSFGGSNLTFVQSDISDNTAGSYAGGVLALNGLIYATQTKFNRNQ